MNRAINSRLDTDDAYYGRGWTYRNQGNKQAAVRDFQQALKISHDSEVRQQAEQELKKLGVR